MNGWLRQMVLLLFILAAAPAHADIVTGLVGWWRFDEMTGTSTRDASGRGNTGTLSGFADPATSTSGWNAGKFNGALAFDGLNDYITIDLGGITTTQLTQSYWIKKTAGADIHRLTTVGGALQCGFTNATFFVHTASSSGSDVNTPFAAFSGSGDGQWHLLVVTRDTASDNKVKVYFDGNLAATGNLVNAANGVMTLGALRIGSATTQSFDGLIDDVRVYKRILSAADMSELLNNGGPSTVIRNATIPNLLIE